MKKLVLLLTALAVICVPLAFAEEPLIPRRVRIEAGMEAVSAITPAILFARLAARTPLVVAGPEDSPHNIIRIESADSGVLQFVLETRDGVADTRVYPASMFDNTENTSRIITEIVDAWTPKLPLVKPDVTEELVVRRELLEAEVSFEERLRTPFQATLWLPAAVRQIVQTNNESGSGGDWLWLWPFRADIAWFPRENLGITGSFRFEYGRGLSFGSFETGFGDVSTDTTNLLLMPGIGIQIRTIGRLSAEFGVSLFFGAVHLTANEPADKPSLNTGDSTWVFFPVLSIEPAIVWSPGERWSIKARLGGFALNLAGMDDQSSRYGTDGNTLIMNYFQLGLAYRW